MNAIVLWQNVKAYVKSQKGQGMVEYGLILALVGVAVVATLTTLGTNISTMFTNVAAKI